MPTPPEGRPWKKGQSGNPAGRPPGKSIRQLLRETAEAEKQAIINSMITLAKTGDVQAASWVARYEDDPSAANLEIATRTFTLRISTPERDSDDA